LLAEDAEVVECLAEDEVERSWWVGDEPGCALAGVVEGVGEGGADQVGELSFVEVVVLDGESVFGAADV